VTTLCIVRHGKTSLNKKNIIIGHLNTPILKSSLEEIIEIASKLKSINFSGIYTSPMVRTMQTAYLLSKEIRGDIIKVPELAEVNYGTMSGMLKKDARKKYQRYHIDKQFVHPGGESFVQMYERVTKFIRHIDKKNGNFLLVTHSGCLRAIYSYYKDEDIQKNIKMTIGHRKILKCINEIDRKTAIFY